VTYLAKLSFLVLSMLVYTLGPSLTSKKQAYIPQMRGGVKAAAGDVADSFEPSL
jgi:hypothetical protein